ncbi:hypothetical protein [Campylobacter ureolyticus]|uniref:hypothetical protein n=1 Tax=Campylobacter ureolyticus TaxID=827 RepID=UPI0022B45CD6|nr:hypothetical protein [Campylobacter ureolyticus]MCZ6134754.1 hypothetical protein [Campylobacter ureolyticus]
MSIYLIDIENVNLELFLKSKNFEKTDKFYLVGNSNLKFSMFVLEFFEDVKYKIYHFKIVLIKTMLIKTMLIKTMLIKTMLIKTMLIKTMLIKTMLIKFFLLF